MHDHPPSRLNPAFRLAVLLLFSTGCQQKDTPQCAPARSALKEAISSQNFEKARSFRPAAYKECANREELRKLDETLVAVEAEGQRRQGALAQSEQRNAALIKVFLDFVAANRTAPEQASVLHVCDKVVDAGASSSTQKKAGEEAGDGTDAGGRFCSLSRKVGTRQIIRGRYWESDPSAFRFSIAPEVPLTCNSVSGKISKSWEVPGADGKNIKRHRCELEGPLSGLTAVVTESPAATLHVISPAYLERDTESRRVFEGS